MERVVAVRFTLGYFVVLFDNWNETVVTAELTCKGDDGGSAPRNGAARTGIVRVAGKVFYIGNCAIGDNGFDRVIPT